MNIKRAKEEIINTIQSYFLKDEYGEYRIPVIHQRPILLLGAPGIGKTQIMEQIAAECRIALVSYTITHHTRQSAIGLPFLSKQVYGDREYTITSYTLSEIVASLYEKMKKTGLSEGILFIDEINCVSETLAPAMLQFLQYKSFGNHQIPEGWIIVAAGNPPEYNKSVRDFDVVTMDRVKKIDVEPQFEVWKEYAYQVGIHPAILSYLNTKPLHFYLMETTIDGMFFATPRGWEDLSRLLQVYEELGKKADKEVVVQYIQHPEIAGDFANYLELYAKYQTDYQIDEIFRGNIPDILLKKLKHAPFDERLGVLGLLSARCANGFREYVAWEDYLQKLHPLLVQIRDAQNGAHASAPETIIRDLQTQVQAEKESLKKAELLTKNQRKVFQRTEDFLGKCLQELRLSESAEPFEQIREIFAKEKTGYDQSYEKAGENLECAFDFLEAAFGNGQEIVLFLTELNASRYGLRFLEHYDCERYYRYNQSLLFEDRSRELLSRIDEAYSES